MSERLGRYQLLHRIAFGGMAEIWLARQDGAQGFEKLVVIKRILPNLAATSEFLVMFFDEARLAAKLSHPNICQIYDLGTEQGSYYIAMEYVHGENLRAVTRRSLERADAPLPPPLAARVISEACQGLHYAHSRTDLTGEPLNVVHRDVSPQNILLGYDGQVKIVDFGIAKAASQLHETKAGVIKGKYAYMSPEQCNGQSLDHRSDLFSLGVVLWEMLTGRRLYLRENELKTMNAICDEPAPPPSSLREAVPADLDRIVLKAIAKSPDDRYQKGEAMHRDLELFLRSQPDLVTPSVIADRMEALFDDRLAAWREVFARSRGAVDVGDLDQHPELFEVGTPSQDPMRPLGTPAGQPATSQPSAPGSKASAPKLEVLSEVPSTSIVVEEILGEADRVAPVPGGTPPPAAGADEAGNDLLDEATALGGVSLESAPARPRRRGRRVAGAVAVTGSVAVVAVLAWAHFDGVGASAPSRAPVSSPAAPAPKPAARPTKPMPAARPMRPQPTAPHVKAPAKVAPKPAPKAPPKAHRTAPAHHHPTHARAAGRRATRGDGYLSLNAVPWCKVTLDGHALGLTPIAHRRIPAGAHELVCTHPELGRRILEIRVRPGKVFRKLIRLSGGGD